MSSDGVDGKAQGGWFGSCTSQRVCGNSPGDGSLRKLDAESDRQDSVVVGISDDEVPARIEEQSRPAGRSGGDPEPQRRRHTLVLGSVGQAPVYGRTG